MSNIVRHEPLDAALRNQPDKVIPTSLQAGLRYHEQEESVTIRHVVARLFRRKHVLAIVFLIVVIPAAVATHLMPRLYRSTALIQVNPDPVQVLPYRDIADRGVGGVNLENYMGTQEQILRGPGLRDRVARRLASDFKGDPAGAEASGLADRLELRKIEKSELFELSYRAASPEAAALVVNLFAEEYVKQNFEMRQATRLKAEQDLQKELSALEGRLQLSEKELTTYAKTHDIISMEQGQVDPLQERLSSLGRQVVEDEVQVVVARASLEALQAASPERFPQRLVTGEIGQLQVRLLQLEENLTTLRSTFGENWPAVVEKRNEVALVRQQLRDEKAAVLARNLEQARLDLQTAEARYTGASRALAEQKALVNQFHDASIEYNILKRDVDTNRNLYEGLLQRLRQTGVMAGFQFGNIQVVEPGRPTRRPDSPNVFWNLALASLLGLGLGFCAVILLELWDNSISTLDDAEQLAPLPTLGSLPWIKPTRASWALPPPAGNGKRAESSLSQRAGIANLVAVQVEDSPLPFRESIRSICASILLSRSDETPRVIVVTSAAHEEGKTTLVTHLGRAFADAGVSTLLVEADLRRPDLSKSFAIGNEDGLSLYLAGHVSPWPKIHQTEVPNLFVAAAGPTPPNPAALLHSERLTHFLKAAASGYGVVIVDAPPLLPVADARILGMKADGVVLVVRAGRTGRNLVRRAWKQLDTAGANVLGMVLNGWEPDRAELSHYPYHHTEA